MKRWRWTIVGFLVLLLLVAGAAGATALRAAALRSRQQWHTRETAALRAKLAADEARLRTADFHRRALEYIRTGGEADPDGRLQWLKEILGMQGAKIVLTEWIDSGRFFPYEEDTFIQTVTLVPTEFIPKDPERLLVALGLFSTFERGSGSYGVRGVDTEFALLDRWNESLRIRYFNAAQLRTLSEGMELLFETRISRLDRSAAQILKFSSGLLRSVDQPEYTGYSYYEPIPVTGKQLWSRTFMVVRLLNGFEQDLLELRSLYSRPQWTLSAASFPAWDSDLGPPHGALLANLRAMTGSTMETQWQATRILTAIARYQAEERRFPATLDELVPGYLSAVPLCPLTGKPWDYKDGLLSLTIEGRTDTWWIPPLRD